jgi:signal transduction histidine kinase
MMADSTNSPTDTRFSAVVDATTPTLVALAALLILMAAIVFVLARPPSALEIEQDIWSAWLTFTVDEQDRTFADLLAPDAPPTHKNAAQGLLQTLGTLVEKNGRRFVIPTRVRYAALFRKGEDQSYAVWRASDLPLDWEFESQRGKSREWVERVYSVIDPRTSDALGQLLVSYQFYYDASVGLEALPRVQRLRQQDAWLLALVAGLAAVVLVAVAVNLLRIRERAARLASQQATIDLARQMCHELRNGLWAFALEGRNLAYFFEAVDSFLAAEPAAFARAAEKTGLDAKAVERFRKQWTRSLAAANAHPDDDLGASHNLAKEAFSHVEGFARYLQLTVEELDRHLLGADALHRPESLSVREVWGEASGLLAIRLRSGDVELVDEFPSDPVIVADRRDLVHVFVNLIKNAVEAMQTVQPPRRIVARTTEEDEFVVIEIVNNGRPISAELMPRMFAKGFTTKPTGRGRGLALVRELVEKSGGRIGVRNDADGVVFSIALPKASAVSPDSGSALT